MNKKFLSTISGTGLLMAACIWGFAFVIVKDSLDYIPAIYMLAFRFTIAAAALAAIYARKLKLLDAAYWKHGAVLGAFLFMAYAFQTVGCKYTTAGKNAFLTTIYVIVVPLIGWPLTRRKPGHRIFMAAVMSLAGIGLLALKNETLSGALAMNFGDILTLICGFFYAAHILFVERWDMQEDPILLTVIQFVFAALFSWIVSPVLDGAFPFEALKSPHVIVSMLYLGIFSTLIAFVLQNVCLKYVPSSIAALFLSMESVFGVLFSMLVLHETMTLRMLAGCVLMFAAILLAELKK
jgi:drug/metabolite transporter (DMT)-like permease